ncbi:MAG: GNAT family N-acetyltransferase [Tabrizicola sp.]
MTLRPATARDLGFIRAITARPDMGAVLTDETEAELALYLTDPESRLLIWEPQGRPAGFALFCEIGHPTGRVELRRLALDRPGSGMGDAFLAALLAHAFADLNAARLWFDVSGENLRAMRIYERAGCRREGIQRAHWWRPELGRAVDLHLFGMMRDEWLARQA